MSSDDLDDDDVAYYADLWGVDDDQAEEYLDAIAQFESHGEIESGVPDPDYMEWLADVFDYDISDLYDMYYGYGPGSEG